MADEIDESVRVHQQRAAETMEVARLASSLVIDVDDEPIPGVNAPFSSATDVIGSGTPSVEMEEGWGWGMGDGAGVVKGKGGGEKKKRKGLEMCNKSLEFYMSIMGGFHAKTLGDPSLSMEICHLLYRVRLPKVGKAHAVAHL